MQKIVISGGAGFIGSHLSERLLKEGFSILCLDTLLTGSKVNIQGLFDNPQFTFIEYDVSKKLNDIKEYFKDVAYVFHLASPASPNKKSERSYINHPIETMLVNSLGTYNLLELAREQNAAFLYASSSEVYGEPAISPQTEDYFGNVNPNGVRSVYDEGKRFGEAMTMGFYRKYGTNIRIIRIFNTYGPRMHKDDGRVVSNFINQAIQNLSLTIYGDGSQTRSFCYVDDLVDGFVKAMFTSGTNGEVMNLGNPDERKIIEIATIIKELTGSQSQMVFDELPEDDPTQRKPDITKANKLLGWEPKISLEEGLKKTIEYFRSL